MDWQREPFQIDHGVQINEWIECPPFSFLYSTLLSLFPQHALYWKCCKCTFLFVLHLNSAQLKVHLISTHSQGWGKINNLVLENLQSVQLPKPFLEGLFKYILLTPFWEYFDSIIWEPSTTEIKEGKATPVENGKLSGMWKDHWAASACKERKPHSNIKDKSGICDLPY